VCHSGLNSVLESLACGVPVLAVPTDPERQSVAARLVRCGAGERIALKEITFSALKDVVRALLTETRYKQNASRIADSIDRAGGERRAADIIEHVLQESEKVSGCATGI
jgi:zeaxanthin glucosyltransferase